MPIANLPHMALHWQQDGDPDGVPVVFANSLGTDLRLWDGVIPLLPQGFRYLRYDKRGHGLSDLPKAPATMGDYAGDIAALLDHLGSGPVVFVGLSIGGMIGLQLAAEQPHRLRAMVLCNAAVKMGDPQGWSDRIAAIKDGGISAIADPILDRWFGAAFRHSAAVPMWRNMLIRTDTKGYLTACRAIRDTDLADSARQLDMPLLALTGSEDQACPPELTRATADLVPRARFAVIDGAGHLPCVETPQAFAARLTEFLLEHAHD